MRVALYIIKQLRVWSLPVRIPRKLECSVSFQGWEEVAAHMVIATRSLETICLIIAGNNVHGLCLNALLHYSIPSKIINRLKTK